jgi:hypothetical protein
MNSTERAKAIKRFHEECLMPSELYDLGFEAATRDLREQLEAAETENGRLRETYKNLYVEGMELGLELAKGSTWHAFTNLKRWHRRFIEHAYDLAQEYLKKHGGE